MILADRKERQWIFVLFNTGTELLTFNKKSQSSSYNRK